MVLTNYSLWGVTLHDNTKNKQLHIRRTEQRAKKVVSNSPGLVDFAIGLLNSALNLPEGQLKVVEKFTLQKNCNQCCISKIFWG